MCELVDLRITHMAQELYRQQLHQQLLQRLPDPYPTMLPVPSPRHLHIPARYGLPGVDVKLQNSDLWTKFNVIGTEMIITKSGRRMFPSIRTSISGLQDDTKYCVLLEMVPVGDCRYKFSGSQWIPGGGAEPQSTQRMYLHPDSPSPGSHWSQQPVLFNKVKLTNNTLDTSGHIVLASMHKYQPRIHIIQAADTSHIPWSPQQAFLFPETEFVAVTAYQNDHITKLKIDNNPFAKGFRETGQSRCKRKLTQSSPSSSSAPSPLLPTVERNQSKDVDDIDAKKVREGSITASDSSLDGIASISAPSSARSSPTSEDIRSIDEERLARFTGPPIQQHQMPWQQFRDNIPPVINPVWMNAAISYFASSPIFYSQHPSYNYVPNTYTPPLIDNPPTMVRSQISPPAENVRTQPRKKSNFTIAAILGCES